MSIDMSPAAMAAILKEAHAELPDELAEALDDPDALRALMRAPGSKLVGAAQRVFTGELLRQAWLQFIPSYGLTLLYLNAHVIIASMTGSRALAPIGSEWSMWRRIIGWPSFGVKYMEIIAIGFLDLVVLTILLLAGALITMVAWAIANPVDAAVLLGEEFMNVFS